MGTPILGRLGDMHGKERVLMIVLAMYGVAFAMCAGALIVGLFAGWAIPSRSRSPGGATAGTTAIAATETSGAGSS